MRRCLSCANATSATAADIAFRRKTSPEKRHARGWRFKIYSISSCPGGRLVGLEQGGAVSLRASRIAE
jgi:hypothetical protein